MTALAAPSSYGAAWRHMAETTGQHGRGRTHLCESDRGEWGACCPDCGVRLPPRPGPVRAWHSTRAIDPDHSAQAHATASRSATGTCEPPCVAFPAPVLRSPSGVPGLDPLEGRCRAPGDRVHAGERARAPGLGMAAHQASTAAEMEDPPGQLPGQGPEIGTVDGLVRRVPRNPERGFRAGTPSPPGSIGRDQGGLQSWVKSAASRLYIADIL